MDSLYTSNKNVDDNVQIIFGFYNRYKESLRTYVWWPLCTSIWTADYISETRLLYDREESIPSVSAEAN